MDLHGMTAAVYLRKSRTEDGLSTDEILRRHRETLTEFADRNGVRVMETFQEIKSGESLYARPEMMRLLEAVEAGRFQAVLCMDIDRLSRGGTRERGIVQEAFEASGTLIVTPSKTFDLSNDSDALVTELHGIFAHVELKKIIERWRRGMARAAKEGKHLAAPPYGYRKRYDGKNSVMEIYEPEAAFVRMAFDWYASGVGCDLIAQRLTECGARPRRAAAFRGESVLKMIRNPVYVGKIVYNREKWTKRDGKIDVKVRPESEWIISDGLHAPIVDAGTFEKCQQILKSRNRPAYFDGRIKNPLTGLVRCKKCGGLMYRIDSKKQYISLHCLTRGCTPSTPYNLAESRVIEALRETLSALEIEPDAPTEAAKASAEARLSGIVKTIDAEKQVRRNIYRLVEREVYSDAEFHERMEAVNATLDALERQRAEVAAEIERLSRADGRRQAAEIRTVLDAYWDADGASRNILLKSVVDVILYSKERGAGRQDFDLEIFLR